MFLNFANIKTNRCSRESGLKPESSKDVPLIGRKVGSLHNKGNNLPSVFFRKGGPNTDHLVHERVTPRSIAKVVNKGLFKCVEHESKS